MPGYRCYLLDADDHILQAYELECADDTEASYAAQRFLKQEADHRAVEIWERTRRIVKVERERLACLAPGFPGSAP